MEKMINKFLDEYLGNEVVCIKKRPSGSCNMYHLCSKKNKTLIILFSVRSDDGEMVIFRSTELTNMIIDLFSIDKHDSMRIVSNWFGGKHSINKVKDLMKFINVYGN